jgi:hypothetical protein
LVFNFLFFIFSNYFINITFSYDKLLKKYRKYEEIYEKYMK